MRKLFSVFSFVVAFSLILLRFSTVSAGPPPSFVPQSHVSEVRNNGNGTYNVNFYAYPKFYKDGAGSWQTANTNIVASSDKSWDYEVTQNIYTAYFLKKINSGDNAKFQTTSNNDLNKYPSSHSISYDQEGLSWVNDEGNSDNISNGTGTGAPSGNVFLYDDAFGTGIDFSYQVVEDMLLKKLTIANFASLPTPKASITNGTNPALKFEFKFSFSSNLNVWIDGAQWDKNVGTKTFTAKTIEFKDTTYNETKFVLPAPYATDSSTITLPETGEVLAAPGRYTLQYEIKKQGNTFLVSILTPYSWLSTATYPVEIDPTVTFQYGDANGELSAVDDTFINQYLPFTNYGTQNPVSLQSTFYKALYKFPNIFGDLSGQIPSTDVTIDSATLDLKTYDNGSSTAVFAYKLLRNWIEGTNGVINATTERGATWDYAELYHNREGISVPWTTAGAANTTSDVSATKQADAGTTPTSSGTSYSWTITNAVTDWMNRTSPNYGVMLYQTGSDYVNFYSGEDPTSTNRPKLSVTYTDLATVDSTAPNTVSNLAASTGSSYQDVNLTWTNPGDDAGAGNPTGYVIKYYTAAINNATDWQNATTYPQTLAGTAVSTTLKLPNAGTTYYFAIKGYDDSANYGGLSNTPSAVANSTVTTISRSTLLLQKGDGNTSSETDDTYIDGAFPHLNIGASTGGLSVTISTARNVKTLIKFPNFMGNDADQVYPKVTINKAYIVGYVSNGSSDTIYAYKMLRDWDEGNLSGTIVNATGEHGVTYLDAESYYNREGQAVSWGTEGAGNTVSDYNSTKLNATGTTPSSSSIYHEFDITNAVQDWVNRTTANYGVLLMKDSGSDWMTIDSSEDTTAVERPQLFVDYSLTGYASDSTAPATVSTLAAATGSNMQQINLTWTAPGDDASSGTPNGYIIRYATSAISNESGFDNATTYPQNKTPAVAGTSESLTVKMPAGGTTYYFAIKAYDEDFNFGALSNSPSAASNNVTTTISSATLYLQKGDGLTSSETDDTYINQPVSVWDNGIATSVGINSTTMKSFIKFPNFMGENSDQVVPKVTVNKAYLILYNNNVSSDTIYAYKMVRNWMEGTENGETLKASGESGMTWYNAEAYYNQQGENVPWGTAGASSTVSDYNSTKLDASGNTPSVSTQWYQYDITSAAQAWVNMTSANYGVLLMKDSGTDAAYFDSSESTTQSQRPILYVDYSLTGYGSDSTAPSAISTLAAATGTAYGNISLTWTATGDNAGTGTATGYLIKYSTSAISNETAFDAATTIPNTISPAASGGSESLTVKMPVGGTTYYFAIKAYDEDFNFGSLSNSPSAASNAVAATITRTTATFYKNDGQTSSETDDLTIYAGAATTEYGTSTGLAVQYHATTPQRFMIKFPDFIGSGATQVPSNVTVNNAYLILYSNNAGDQVFAYKMLQDWTEGTQTGAVVDTAGEYGTTWNNAQVMGSADTTINDADGITASDTTITIATITSGNYPTTGLVKIDNEIIKYSNIGNTSITVATNGRGWSATTAATHANSAAVAFDIAWSTVGADHTTYDRSNTQQDSNPGAPSSTSTRYDFKITSAVQDWVSGTTGNYGVIFIQPSGGDYVAFDSSENTKPVLYVDYVMKDSTAPSAVSNLAAGTATTSSINLTWTDQSDDGGSTGAGNVTSYQVKYSTSAGIYTSAQWDAATTFSQSWTVSAPGASHTQTVSGLSADTTYYFAMKSCDEASPTVNCSAISNTVSLATSDATAPTALSTLAVSNPTTSSVVLSWTEQSDNGGSGGTGNVSSYTVKYSTSTITSLNFDSATTFSQSWPVQAPNTTHSDIITGLSADTTYYFAVKSCDEVANCSLISNVVSTATLDTTAPSAISTLATSSVGASSVVLTWTEQSDNGNQSGTGNVTSYTLKYSTSSAITSNTLFNEATTYTQSWTVSAPNASHSETISGLSSDTTYYFSLKSCDEANNCSIISNSPNAITTTDPTVPSAITDLTISNVTSSGFNVTWTEQSDNGGPSGSGNISSYTVKYSTSAITSNTLFTNATTYSQSWTPLAPGNSHTETLSGLSADTTYYIAIKSCDSVPNCSSIAASGPSQKTTDSVAPDAVTGLSAGTATSSTISLTWTEPSDNGGAAGSGNVTSYTVKYSTSAITSGNFSSATTFSQNWAASSPGASHTETVSGLTATTTYYFAIKICDEVPNCSTISNVPSLTTSTGGATMPSAITNLATSNVSTSSVNLTWTEQSRYGNNTGDGNISSYTVKYSTSPISSETAFSAATTYSQSWIPLTPGTSHTETLSGFSADTTYYFAIKSCNASECATLSNAPSAATTDSVAPDALSTLSVVSTSTDNTILRWTEVSDNGGASGSGNVTSYTVKYSTSLITESNFASATTFSNSWTAQSPNTTHQEVVTGLSAGTGYYFAIKVCDSVSNCSAISNVISGTTRSNRPSAVSNLAISGVTTSGLILTWTEQSEFSDENGSGNVSSYTVKYSSSAIANDTDFANATTYTQSWTAGAPGSTHTQTISGISADTLYYFALKSCNSLNCSNISNAPNASTLDQTAPSAVSDLATGTASTTSIILSWTEVSDNGGASGSGKVTSYSFKYSTVAITADNFSLATTFSQNWAAQNPNTTHSVTITGLTQSTTYYFALKSCDEVSNCSAISNVLSVLTASTVTASSSSSTTPATFGGGSNSSSGSSSGSSSSSSGGSNSSSGGTQGSSDSKNSSGSSQEASDISSETQEPSSDGSSESSSESSSDASSDGSSSGNSSSVDSEKTTNESERIALLEQEIEKLKKKLDTMSEELTNIGHWSRDYMVALYRRIIFVEQIALEKGTIMKSDAFLSYDKDVQIFDPNRKLNRAEVVKITLQAFGYLVDDSSLAEQASTSEPLFSDVKQEDWFRPYIVKANNLKIIQGYPDGSFRPTATINRAETLKIVAAAKGVDFSAIDSALTGGQDILDFFKLGKNPFSDVYENEWYAKYVFYAYSNGVVQGYDDGSFRPEQEVTQAEFSKIAVKMAESSEENKNSTDESSQSSTQSTQAAEEKLQWTPIRAVMKDAVMKNKVMKESDTLKPTLLKRVLKRIEQFFE